MTETQPHSANNTDFENLRRRLGAIIAWALSQAVDDYRDILTANEETDSDSPRQALAEKHKRGKIILSHIEALMKLESEYHAREDADTATSGVCKRALISEARHSLKRLKTE